MDEQVLRVLAEARTLGFLGPGDLAVHVGQAVAFANALRRRCQTQLRVLDLGSGGGVPGLVLASWFPCIRWVLLDVQRRRTSFLTRAVAELGWAERVAVVHREATEAGRDPQLRGRFSAVTSRSFGPPARSAECGVPFLMDGGWLLVADSPAQRSERWPAEGLALLGLHDEGDERSGTGTVRILRRSGELGQSIPRARRKIEQRPLW